MNPPPRYIRNIGELRALQNAQYALLNLFSLLWLMDIYSADPKCPHESSYFRIEVKIRRDIIPARLKQLLRLLAEAAACCSSLLDVCLIQSLWLPTLTKAVIMLRNGEQGKT